MEKVDPETDKVRFAIDSEEETEIAETVIENTNKKAEKVTDKKADSETLRNVEHLDLKKPKPGRKGRKVRHASSGGSSGDVFPSSTRCRLGSTKRRSRRATESSRTSDDDHATSLRCRRSRNLSQEVEEADEIRGLDDEFDEANFGGMRITLTGPSRNRKICQCWLFPFLKQFLYR